MNGGMASLAGSWFWSLLGGGAGAGSAGGGSTKPAHAAIDAPEGWPAFAMQLAALQSPPVMDTIDPEDPFAGAKPVAPDAGGVAGGTMPSPSSGDGASGVEALGAPAFGTTAQLLGGALRGRADQTSVAVDVAAAQHPEVSPGTTDTNPGTTPGTTGPVDEGLGAAATAAKAAAVSGIDDAIALDRTPSVESTAQPLTARGADGSSDAAVPPTAPTSNAAAAAPTDASGTPTDPTGLPLGTLTVTDAERLLEAGTLQIAVAAAGSAGTGTAEISEKALDGKPARSTDPRGGLAAAARAPLATPTTPTAPADAPDPSALVARQNEAGEAAALARILGRSTQPEALDSFVRSALDDLASSADTLKVELVQSRETMVREPAAWRVSAREIGARLASSAGATDTAKAVAEASSTQGEETESDLAGDPSRARIPFPTTTATTTDLPVEPVAPAVAGHDPAARVTSTMTTELGEDTLRSAAAEPVSAQPTAPSPSVVAAPPATGPEHADLGARLRQAVAESIVEQGRDRLLSSVKTTFEARISVQPENLGLVQVQVSRSAAQAGLEVLLLAAHEDAARALEAESDELVDELVRNRLEVHQVQVRHGQESGNDGDRMAQQRQQWAEARERRQAQEFEQERRSRDPEDRRQRQAADGGLDPEA